MATATASNNVNLCVKLPMLANLPSQGKARKSSTGAANRERAVHLDDDAAAGASKRKRGSTSSGSDGDDKKQKRLQRNRCAAQKSREKKKMLVEGLHDKVQTLTQLNTKLVLRVQELEEQLQRQHQSDRRSSMSPTAAAAATPTYCSSNAPSQQHSPATSSSPAAAPLESNVMVLDQLAAGEDEDEDGEGVDPNIYCRSPFPFPLLPSQQHQAQQQPVRFHRHPQQPFQLMFKPVLLNECELASLSNLSAAGASAVRTFSLQLEALRFAQAWLTQTVMQLLLLTIGQASAILIQAFSLMSFAELLHVTLGAFAAGHSSSKAPQSCVVTCAGAAGASLPNPNATALPVPVGLVLAKRPP